MSQTQKMKPLDLLKRAREKKNVSIIFDIPLDDTSIKAELTAIAASEIMIEQDLVLLDKLADCEKRGLHEKPFVESKWRKEISQFDAETKKRLEVDKPTNAAEQHAQRFVWYETIRSLIPKHLNDPTTGGLLFPDAQDQEVFRELLASDAELFKLLTEKWRELNDKLGLIGDEAKN